MQSKPLWTVSITTSPEAEDAVAELLNSIVGTPACAYQDVECGISTVTVYVPGQWSPRRRLRETILAGLNRIKSCGLDVGPNKLVIARMPGRNWAESWKRHFKPIEIGDGLLIKPGWSKRRPRKKQAVVVLDPGLSFGTGHHPTTAFCLAEIVRLKEEMSSVSWRLDVPGNRPCPELSFLDLGTGSGILAIAAAKSGYSPVHALDFDPAAVRIALANARANGVDRQITIRRGDVTRLSPCPGRRGQRYDLICANLAAELLVAERDGITARLKPAGRLVLAGILEKEFSKIRRAYGGLGLRLRVRKNERGWCSGSFGF